MAQKMIYIVIMATLLVHVVKSNDLDPIPSDYTKLNTWFQNNVQPLSSRKSSLDPDLVQAEGNIKVIRVSKDGKGDFTSITDALKSIPDGNTQRIIVAISGGTYIEKITVTQLYVTFYGNPSSQPILVFNGTAKNYGSYYCGTLIVSGGYFVASNIIFKNSAPRPDPTKSDEQGVAVAVAILGEKAAFYNSKFYGFQDTLLDEGYAHFYKDCYIEGTVDFIFGRGKSIFMNTELHVVPGNMGHPCNVVTSHFRNSSSSDEGYSFVHCYVTGTGETTLLGRALWPYATVVYSYTNMSNVVYPQGWSVDSTSFASSVFFREYKNSGDGSAVTDRVPFSRQLNDREATTFLTLAYIQGSKWLLPPPNL